MPWVAHWCAVRALPVWVGLLAATVSAPAAGQPTDRKLLKVPVKPMTQSARADDWVVGRAKRRMCLDAGRIAAAEVMDHRTLDVVLRGGQRWRLLLERDCSQLTFYGGFYYNPAEAGQICAGRDQLVGRAGGACAVRAIVPLKRKQR